MSNATVYVDGKKDSSLSKSASVQFPQIEKLNIGDFIREGTAFYEVYHRAFIYDANNGKYEIDMVWLRTVHPIL